MNIKSIQWFIGIVLILIFQTSHAQDVYFEDNKLFSKIKGNGVDTSGDGIIQVSEAEAVTSLTIERAEGISSLTGLEAFINLETLVFETYWGRYFNRVLDVSVLPKLKVLDTYGIKKVNIGQLDSLKTAKFVYSPIDSADFSQAKNLETISISSNQMEYLKVAGLSKLKSIRIGGNLNSPSNTFDALDLTGLVSLEDLYINTIKIDSLDLSPAIQLREIDFPNSSLLKTLDLRANKELRSIIITESQHLESINVTGLDSLGFMNFNNDTLLTTVIGSETLKNLEGVGITHTPIDYTTLGIDFSKLDFMSLNECIPMLDENKVYDYIIIQDENSCFNVIPEAEWGIVLWESRVVPFTPNVCNRLNNVLGCKNYPVIEGNIFSDINKNGTKEEDEFGYKGVELVFEPGDYSTFTDDEGNYYKSLPDTGTYTVSVITPNLFDATPQTFTVHLGNTFDIVNQDVALQPNEIMKDVSVNISSFSRSRPGFDMEYIIDYGNVGTEVVESSIITFQIPNSFEIDPTIENVFVNGNFLNINVGRLQSGQQGRFRIYGKTALNTLGTEELVIVNMNTFTTESDYTNNADTISYTVTGSFDPNDKLGVDSVFISEIEQGKILDYRIRFQNTGTDTAFTVILKDTLSELLDLSTLMMKSTSHTMTSELEDNTLIMTFNDILLVDSVTNEPDSHGFIYYEIQPYTDLLVGDSILNSASIYFDFNDPIVTNTTVTRIVDNPEEEIIASRNEINTSTHKIYPNPSNHILTLDIGTREVEMFDSNGVKQPIRWLFSKNQISVAHLSPGIYHLRWVGTDGFIYSESIVKK
ncbi:hypothetical protein MY04_3170 [Flammeovirga sp. MY04]|uniref:DUF7619 domain-containing protein n=1 Tax=Flammeovirga sp. MY04 TaxID=1191459 RepID=UPI0008062912|nr:T9SS type A sorting domain-containing protein [Flammeovirga sp. MY04]ANQ50535.1 hypothetical protein MY04_3170 [Flammeovirga sp. MY04]